MKIIRDLWQISMFFGYYDRAVTNRTKMSTNQKKAPTIIVGAFNSNFIEMYQRFYDLLICPESPSEDFR